MNNNQQVAQYLQELKLQYPNAFKKNLLLYSQIKTKGILDDRKELIPLALSLIIFLPICYLLSMIIAEHQPILEGYRAGGTAVLLIMLFFMVISPLVLKQIKHSSISTYHQLKNTPFKLTILIVIQTLNIGFLESWFVQGVLFYFAICFGFIKFYKENLFRETTTTEQYYYIQEIRRIAFWSYKQNFKYYLKLKLCSSHTKEYQSILQQKAQNADLYVNLMNFENKLCIQYKHTDIENYIDSIM